MPLILCPMKVTYIDNNKFEITGKFSTKQFEYKEIKKIFISVNNFLFLRFYYLNIVDNKNNLTYLKFSKIDKEQIKKEVVKIKSFIEWGIPLNENSQIHY